MADDETATDQITREHIDHIRRKLANVANKTPENQEIQLKFDEIERPTKSGGSSKRVVKLAQLIIKSGAKNALSGKMICDLTDRLDELYCWLDTSGTSKPDESSGQPDDLDARCLIIRGHEGTFCSGSDLVSVRETLSQPAAWELAQLMQYNLARLEQLPLVSVAFVQGYALGGGAELTLGADLRLMSGKCPRQNKRTGRPEEHSSSPSRLTVSATSLTRCTPDSGRKTTTRPLFASPTNRPR